MKKCVRIQVSFDGSGLMFATLADVFYHAKCSFYQNMQKSTGTISLLHASLACLLILFPRISYMIISDNSLVNCERISGTTGVDWGSRPAGFSKAEHSMLKYGCTWYQRVFPKLKPNGRLTKLAYKTFKDKLNQDIPKGTFETFWKAIHDFSRAFNFMPRVKAWCQHPDVVKDAREAFSNCQTYGQFFKWLCGFLAKTTDTTTALKPSRCTFEQEYFLEVLPRIRAYLTLPPLAMTTWILDLSKVRPPLASDGFVLNRAREYDGQNFRIIRRVFPSAVSNSEYI